MRPSRREDTEGALHLCIDCDGEGAPNRIFCLRDAEASWFRDPDMQTPKRCPRHRELKKQRNVASG